VQVFSRKWDYYSVTVTILNPQPGAGRRNPTPGSQKATGAGPLWPGARIEQDADDGEVERGAPALVRVAPSCGLVDLAPPVALADDEVSPA